ncbi:MAG: hypothetical protein MZW92_54310 [Comamonadaceae bacterium]|nr:hypothetical protein [Comamonadaceae bacterium]
MRHCVPYLGSGGKRSRALACSPHLDHRMDLTPPPSPPAVRRCRRGRGRWSCRCGRWPFRRPTTCRERAPHRRDGGRRRAQGTMPRRLSVKTVLLARPGAADRVVDRRQLHAGRAGGAPAPRARCRASIC